MLDLLLNFGQFEFFFLLIMICRFIHIIVTGHRPDALSPKYLSQKVAFIRFNREILTAGVTKMVISRLNLCYRLEIARPKKLLLLSDHPVTLIVFLVESLLGFCTSRRSLLLLVDTGYSDLELLLGSIFKDF
jgi:hypothetical protein